MYRLPIVQNFPVDSNKFNNPQSDLVVAVDSGSGSEAIQGLEGNYCWRSRSWGICVVDCGVSGGFRISIQGMFDRFHERAVSSSPPKFASLPNVQNEKMHC